MAMNSNAAKLDATYEWAKRTLGKLDALDENNRALVLARLLRAKFKQIEHLAVTRERKREMRNRSGVEAILTGKSEGKNDDLY